MGLENVDEKRFSVEEAVALVGTGFGEVLPFIQTVVSAVTLGNSWGNVLRRYLIGESIRIRVGLGGDAGVFCYPPGADISDEQVRRQLESVAFDDEQGRIVPTTEIQGSPSNRVFEIGETVRKVVMKAKSIDVARANQLTDAAYSLREISAMAARESLEAQWVG